MLVSRLFTRALVMCPVFAYNSPPSQLFNRAIATKNLSQFANLVSQNKTELTGEFYASVSRHLSGLAFNSERADYKEGRAVLNALESLTISSLSLRNISSLLSILRAFQTQGWIASKLRSELVAQLMALIKERESTERDLSDLVNSYSELSQLRQPEGKLIAERILKVLEAQEEGRGLTDGQIILLMQGIASRSDLTTVQIRLRSFILREVGASVATMRLQDLVRLAAHINSMDLFELEPSDFSVIKQISDRISAGIIELDERSIYDLIRAKNIGKAPGLQKIYEEIFKNIFAEINEKGESELGHDSIFRVLSFLSDKLNLSKATAPEQAKFFSWLEKYARTCAREQGKGKMLISKVMRLISNNFFPESQKAKFIEILQKNGAELNINSLYELALHDYDLLPIANSILSTPIDRFSGQLLLRLGVAAHKLAFKTGLPEATAQSNAIKEKLAEQINTPEKFVQFYKRFLMRGDVNLWAFQEAFGELVEQLQSPLEQGAAEVAGYRRAYLEYHFEALRGQRFSQFFQKHENAISWAELGELLKHHVKGDPRELQPRRHILFYLARRIYDLVESKDKTAIEGVIEVVAKYNRFVVLGQLEVSTTNSIFRLLHNLISKTELLNELNLANYFYSTLDRYLVRSTRNYNIQGNFRQLLRHLCDVLPKFSKARIANSIVREGIRLNVLSKRQLEGVEIESLRLGYLEKARLQYIRDSTFVPKLDKINVGSLEVIFSNHNLQGMLEEHEKLIHEMLQTASVQTLASFLVLFNHKSPVGRRLLNQILNQAVGKLKTLERVDIVGVFQNALSHNYFYLPQYRRICEKVVEFYGNNINRYSLESHQELLRFIPSQPFAKRGDYYSKLVASADKREEISDLAFEQLLIRLAGTDYKFRLEDLTHITKMIKRNPQTGLHFFLMVEPILEDDLRLASVKDIAAGLQEKKPRIQNLYYRYLKKKYPEETAALTYEEKDLSEEVYLSRPKSEDCLNAIVNLAGGNSQQLAILGAQNYLAKVKNYVFGFINTKRQGATYQQDFLRRAVSVLHGQPLTTVFLHLTSSPASSLQFINKQCPNLFNPAEFQKALEEHKVRHTRKPEQSKE